MKKENWIWMPHPGHLCVASQCKFHLNTYVGGYIVSTVGEWLPNHRIVKDKLDFEEIGRGRLYETMVFKARKSKNKCCLWEQIGSELDMEGYNTPEDAFAGHMKLSKKWAAK